MAGNPIQETGIQCTRQRAPRPIALSRVSVRLIVDIYLRTPLRHQTLLKRCHEVHNRPLDPQIFTLLCSFPSSRSVFRLELTADGQPAEDRIASDADGRVSSSAVERRLIDLLLSRMCCFVREVPAAGVFCSKSAQCNRTPSERRVTWHRNSATSPGFASRRQLFLDYDLGCL